MQPAFFMATHTRTHGNEEFDPLFFLKAPGSQANFKQESYCYYYYYYYYCYYLVFLSTYLE